MTGTATSLTWALVVATKDRLDALQHCVRFALGQSRPPSEVIIVDASATWEAHRETITALLAQHADIRFTYLQAARPSAAVQRNQGIQEAGADILFLIDDDSFLYPQAAANVLHLYEADQGLELAGVQMKPANHPPRGVPDAPQKVQARLQSVATRPGLWRRSLRWLLSYGPEGSFIPYDGQWPDRPIPEALANFNVKPARLFEGFRMTLRRDIAAALMFEPLLLYYSPGEDLDLSFRASREGALLTTQDAEVHHFVAKGGRLQRRQVELLSTLNQALFLRRHAMDQGRARARFIRWALHRAFAGLVADLAGRRPGLPKLRGALAALPFARHVFRAEMSELETLYPALQETIVKSKAR